MLNLFKRKPSDRAIKKFWKEFCGRADLYADILRSEPEDSEDYLWLLEKVGKSLKLCCLIRRSGTISVSMRCATPSGWCFCIKTTSI